VERLVDELTKRGLRPSTVRNAIDPLGRIFDYAIKRDLIPYSPWGHLDMPRGTGKRERVATPAEAHALIAALRRARALGCGVLRRPPHGELRAALV
jgi:site-specific recombinase XerD